MAKKKFDDMMDKTDDIDENKILRSQKLQVKDEYKSDTKRV